MNKLVIIVIAFIVINGGFSLLGFIVPTTPIDKIAPIQLWVNALLVFCCFLPNRRAEYLNYI
tara:strand:+ start:5440 stop:5625 length:186 start_codon:yes stop_codon:yes gene_type:complete